MRLRFWKLVHSLLERAWHWVYYAKLYPEIQQWASDNNASPNYSYTIQFIDSRGNVITGT